jgi:hypothetical protein
VKGTYSFPEFIVCGGGMHRVRRLFAFSVEIAKPERGLMGMPIFFSAFIRRCSRILEETNLFPPESFWNPPSTSWLGRFWLYYIWAS